MHVTPTHSEAGVIACSGRPGVGSGSRNRPQTSSPESSDRRRTNAAHTPTLVCKRPRALRAPAHRGGATRPGAESPGPTYPLFTWGWVARQTPRSGVLPRQRRGESLTEPPPALCIEPGAVPLEAAWRITQPCTRCCAAFRGTHCTSRRWRPCHPRSRSAQAARRNHRQSP